MQSGAAFLDGKAALAWSLCDAPTGKMLEAVFGHPHCRSAGCLSGWQEAAATWPECHTAEERFKILTDQCEACAPNHT